MTKPLTSRWATDKAGEICARHGLSMKDVKSRRAGRWFVQCRTAIARSLAGGGYSQTEIGLVINRDPSTVNYMLRGRKQHGG